MKDIINYLNEALINKDTKIKNLDKAIEHIKFSGYTKYFENELKHWPQNKLDKIKTFKVIYYSGDLESEYDIIINDGEYSHYIRFELQKDEHFTWNEITDSSIRRLIGKNMGWEKIFCIELRKEIN